ncbi:MAG TPA: Cys-tRNA(Pro) deacylase [Nakamurella sp.]
MPAAPTPAIAALLRAKVEHTLHPYHHDPGTTAFGDEVVTALGWDPERVFKTLVASVDGALVVGIVPVAAQLDLKALASAVGGKKAQLAKVADAERSSGYVAGGISPLGQRQPLRTVLDAGADRYSTIMVSAGKRGLQVELAPADLVALCQATVADIAAR